jgi:cbb3-type cytochrome oxidase subunit 3
MLREMLSRIPLFDLPIVAMAIFVLFFAGVLVRVSRKARAAEYRRMASLPLADDQHPRRNP